MATPKYQIFISSTYKDLRDEREQIVKATLKMGHFPVGMEMFNAANEDQWRIITKRIDESDYYVVIVGHCYGSVDENGVSYTEREYDYAVSKNIPVIGFVIDDSAAWSGTRDMDVKKQFPLSLFKDKVKSKMVDFWSTKEDLHGKFAIAFMGLMSDHPRGGWVPANEAANPETSAEVVRLSRENGILREQLQEAHRQSQSEKIIDNAETARILRKNSEAVSVFFDDASEWEEVEMVSLYTIFFTLSGELIVESSLERMAQYFAYAHVSKETRKARAMRKDWPIPLNSLQDWLSDFASLDLVEPSERPHSENDTSEYWSLTKKGREFYLAMRRERLLKVNEQNNASAPDAEDLSNTS